MVNRSNGQMEETRAALWKNYWQGSQRRTPLARLVWLARSFYSTPTAELLASACSGKDAISTLEIGCGSATTTRDLSLRVQTALSVGLDIVHESLAHASERVPELCSLVGDALNVPIANPRFDLVFSIGLIEHFSRDTAAEIVREHARVTRPGGIVAVTVPNGSSPLDLIRKGMGSRWPFGVEYPFSPAELLTFFESLDLIDCKVHVIHSYRLLATGRVRHS